MTDDNVIQQTKQKKPKVRAIIGDWLLIIVQPFNVLGKERSSHEAAILFFAILLADFFVSLLLLPSAVEQMQVEWNKVGEVSRAAKASSLGMAIVVATIINTLILSVFAVMIRLFLYFLNQQAHFSSLIARIILASLPLIVERLARGVLFFAGTRLEGWREISTLGGITGIELEGTIGAALGFYSFFDALFFIYLVIAIRKSADVGIVTSIMVSALTWGVYLALVLRLHILGYVA